MPVIRRGDQNGVDVLTLDDSAKIVVLVAPLVGCSTALFLLNAILGDFASVGINIADGHDLHVIKAQQRVHVVPAAHFPCTD